MDLELAPAKPAEEFKFLNAPRARDLQAVVDRLVGDSPRVALPLEGPFTTVRLSGR
ncbi:MAG: hypothetical protein AB1641_14375 [Thermodesulfobacteriota bacterium]